MGWQDGYNARFDLNMHDARYGQNDCEIPQGRRVWLFAQTQQGARVKLVLQARGLPPRDSLAKLTKDRVSVKAASLTW